MVDLTATTFTEKTLSINDLISGGKFYEHGQWSLYYKQTYARTRHVTRTLMRQCGFYLCVNHHQCPLVFGLQIVANAISSVSSAPPVPLIDCALTSSFSQQVRVRWVCLYP